MNSNSRLSQLQTVSNISENESNSMDCNEMNNIPLDAFQSDIESEVSEIDEQRFDDLEENEFCDFNDDSQDTGEFFEERNRYAHQNTADLCTLHPHTDCTIYDAYLMIFIFSKRHSMTWEATEDLARLMNRIIGAEKIRPSKHLFKQKFMPDDCSAVKHFVCHECDLYLGTLSQLNSSKMNNCPNCKVEIQLNTKYKKNHFLTIPFRNHMQQVLHQNSEHLTLNADPPNSDICDVHDGLYFQNLRNNVGNIPYITLTFSTDGATVFKSTKDKSVWPVQFIINEIDLKYRFKRENVFCAAVAFGKTPNMQVFLKTFIEEITQINIEGGLSFETKNGEIIKVLIYPMIFTSDILAKQYVLNKASFHGYYGCSYCLHKGTLVDKRVRYCKKSNVTCRTNENTRADMLQAQNSGENVKGFKGVSALMALQYFDIVWQPAIDKMHNIDMGIIKKLFSLFLDNENRKER